ncbi:MAG: TetR/AcrR family transcriptional regulator [Gammaproteobacteria bacterium]|nr:TetR/AcrR family transcriptional regulator [Gammaproteobacteria bacterium]
MARPAKFNDAEVLARATDLFWKRGSDAVSMRDLELALELRAPSIYRRFHSKDALLKRCIERYVDEEVGNRIRFFLDDAEDPLLGIQRFFTSALQHHRGEPRRRGCLLTSTAGSAAGSTPEIRRAINRGFATIETAFREQLQRAITAGQIDIDPQAGAKALQLSFQGLLVLARSGTRDLQANIDATFESLAASGSR